MIKIILVALILVALVWTLRHRDHVGLRAVRRLLVLMLAAFAVVAVVDPNLTTRAAHTVGVNRGTDLLLYALFIAFVFATAGLYFRFRDIDRRVVALSRSVAIRDALREDGPPGQLRVPAR